MTNPEIKNHSIWISTREEIKEQTKEIEIDREERESHNIK